MTAERYPIANRQENTVYHEKFDADLVLQSRCPHMATGRTVPYAWVWDDRPALEAALTDLMMEWRTRHTCSCAPILLPEERHARDCRPDDAP